MLLRLKETIGTPIVTERQGSVIGMIKAPIIDPETGQVVALMVGVLKQKVLVPRDIIKWSRGVIYIHDAADIVSIEEILRAKEVFKKYTPIFGEKVFTKSGEFLGKVFDYEINTEKMALSKIFTAKELLLFRYDKIEIPSKNIIEIRRKKIIVKDRGVKVIKKEESPSRVVIPA